MCGRNVDNADKKHTASGYGIYNSHQLWHNLLLSGKHTFNKYIVLSLFHIKGCLGQPFFFSCYNKLCTAHNKTGKHKNGQIQIVILANSFQLILYLFPYDMICIYNYYIYLGYRNLVISLYKSFHIPGYYFSGRSDCQAFTL